MLQVSAAGASPVMTTLQVTDDENPMSPPPGYYAAASGLAGGLLKSTLKATISAGHVPIAYGDMGTDRVLLSAVAHGK